MRVNLIEFTRGEYRAEHKIKKQNDPRLYLSLADCTDQEAINVAGALAAANRQNYDIYTIIGGRNLILATVTK